MSKRDPAILIDDVILALDKIERYTVGLNRETFLADEKTIDAAVRNLEIIGEAVRQLPREFKEKHSSIQWEKIAGMRNRIVHDYAGIDLDLIWHIIKENLQIFRAQLNSLK